MTKNDKDWRGTADTVEGLGACHALDGGCFGNSSEHRELLLPFLCRARHNTSCEGSALKIQMCLHKIDKLP